MGFYSEVSADSPYGWFKLNETSGLTVANAGSGGNASYSFSNTTNITRGSTGIVNETGNKAVTYGTPAPNGTVNLGSTAFGADMENNNALTVEWIFKFTNSTNGAATAIRQATDSTGFSAAAYIDPSTYKLNVYGWVRSYFDTLTEAFTNITAGTTDWYHVVFTYSSSGTKIYVNGKEEASKTLSSYTWAATTGTSAYLFNQNGTYNLSQNSITDEIILYRSTLSAARVLDHAVASGVKVDASISAPSSNITLDAKDATVDILLEAYVSATVTNIALDAKDATVETSNPVTVTADVTNIAVDAQDVALILDQNLTANVTNVDITAHQAGFATELTIDILAETPNINIAGKDVITSIPISVNVISSNIYLVAENVVVNATVTATIEPDVTNINITGKDTGTDTGWRFISANSSVMTANDAEALANLNFNTLFANRTKKLLFRIGNLSNNTRNYTITIDSSSQQVIDAITLSYDDITYSDTLSIPSIKPNAITELIYIKFDASQLDGFGPGTFLINVEQS